MIAAATSISWMLNAYFLQFGGTPPWVILLIILLIILLFWWGLTRNSVKEPQADIDEHASEEASTALAAEAVDSADHDAVEAALVDEGAPADLDDEDMAEPAVLVTAVANSVISEDIDTEEPSITAHESGVVSIEMDEGETDEEIVIETPAAPLEPDDLKKIEGIGPKISDILNESGITTFQQLADTDTAVLKKIVREDAGIRIAHVDNWPQQASLAAAGDWDGLEKLQDKLIAGR